MATFILANGQTIEADNPAPSSGGDAMEEVALRLTSADGRVTFISILVFEGDSIKDAIQRQFGIEVLLSEEELQLLRAKPQGST